MDRKDSKLSELRSKRGEMSSLAEMSSLVREVADYSAPSPNWKERVNAASRVLRLPFGRVKAHYYGEARRVDAEEMDRARTAARQLRDVKRRTEEHEHLAWLECEISRQRATGQGFHGPHVDGLEHFLRLARDASGAVEVSAEDEDQSREWGGASAVSD